MGAAFSSIRRSDYVSLETEAQPLVEEEVASDELVDPGNASIWHTIVRVVMYAVLIVWAGSYLIIVLVFLSPAPAQQLWDHVRKHRVKILAATGGLLIAIGIVRFRQVGSRILAEAKAAFVIFKRTNLGIFLLDRWLKVQDMGSDAWVTFCPEGAPLCPNGGLLWSEDWWWGHISLFILVNTFILMLVLTTPIFVKQINLKFNIGICFSIIAWAIVGPFAILFLDVFMLFRHPCSEPRFGWLTNIARVQKCVEALLEAPLQSSLQVWIFFQRSFISHRDEYSFPWALCFSGCTSIASFALSLLDIKGAAEAQDISFAACLEDLFLVALERRAPLVHLLPTRPHVVYDEEGPLTDEQVEQIVQVALKCSNLESLSFARSNELSRVAYNRLLKCPFQLEIDGEIQPNWMLTVQRGFYTSKSCSSSQA